MKFYTYKNINQVTQFMNEKQTNKQRSILRIATENGVLFKCSEKRFEIAKKLYNAVKTLNKYRENELNFDSVFNVDQREFYNQKQSKLLFKIKPLAKALNLEVYCETWWHLKTKENQDIYF